ncbi:MAG: hypothetical protein IJ507_05030 [Clostridia bacterium]|nr:hypothetical protein [Clostridia bacterium]
MAPQELLERALASFAGSYDISRDAQILDRRAEALCQLRAMNSKYMLKKKWVVWEANAFEHCVFVTAKTLTADVVRDWFDFLTKEAEAELVHPGAKYPPEGHMYTYLTTVFLCDTMEPEAAKAVRRLRFSKNYLFTFRGWASGRALAAETSTGRIVVNQAGKPMKKLFVRLLNPKNK